MKNPTKFSIIAFGAIILTSATAVADWQQCGWDSVSGTRTDDTRIDLECREYPNEVKVRIRSVGTRGFDHIDVRGYLKFENGLESERTATLHTKSSIDEFLDSDAGFSTIADWRILDIDVEWKDAPEESATDDAESSDEASPDETSSGTQSNNGPWEICAWASPSGQHSDPNRVDVWCRQTSSAVHTEVRKIPDRKFKSLRVSARLKYDSGQSFAMSENHYPSPGSSATFSDADAGYAGLVDYEITDVEASWEEALKSNSSDSSDSSTDTSDSSTNTSGGDSASGGSTSSNASALGTAAQVADQAKVSAEEDSDSGGAVATGGGVAGLATGAVSGAIGSSSGGDRETEALHNFVTRNPNAWRPYVIGFSIGVGAILMVNGIAALAKSRGAFERRASDRQQPHEFHPLAVLFGPDGPGDWWSRFEFLPMMGLFRTTYSGAYIDRVPDRGVAIERPLTGISSGAAVHYGIFRVSLAYVGSNVKMFEGVERDLTSRFDYPVLYPETQTLQGVEGSVGVQAFQGLLSPYLEARFTHLRPAAPVATLREDVDDYFDLQKTYNLGAFYLPTSWNLVLGNTFNFAGSLSSKGPLRSSFFVDASLALANLNGPLSGGFRLVGGFGLSWF